jgi:multisubunit Na+/H+ antiporter MnhG subunit
MDNHIANQAQKVAITFGVIFVAVGLLLHFLGAQSAAMGALGTAVFFIGFATGVEAGLAISREYRG